MKTHKDAAKWLDINKLPYWRVLMAAGAKNPVAKSLSLERDAKGTAISEINIQESIAFFEQNAELLNPGLYILIARTSDKSTNAEQEYTFSIPQPESEAQAPTPSHYPGGFNSTTTAINGINTAHYSEINTLKDQIRELQSLVDEQRREYEKEKEIEKIKRRYEKQKENGKGGLDQFQNIIAQLQVLMAKPPAVAQAAVAGNPAAHQKGSEQAQANTTALKIQNALKVLSDVLGGDSERLAGILSTFAQIAKENPAWFLEYVSQFEPQTSTTESK